MTAANPPSEVELELQVAAVDEAAVGIRCLHLAHPAGVTLPPWSPGAHIDFTAGDVVRQYSLCGDPADPTLWRVAILREPDSRGGSAFIHDQLREGDLVRVRGPRNHFPLIPAPRYLFIAGGIGITPLLPMLAAADTAGADWRLIYGGRTRASMAFATELADRYGPRVELRPQDEFGLLPLGQLLTGPSPDTLVYCCGPTPLLAAVEQHCQAWPEGSLHVEHFAPKEPIVTATDGAFEVELRDSGLVLTVPADSSILQTVRDAGTEILSSCEEGTCGTCETEVLDGRIDHRDSILTAAERAADDIMYICVSRAAAGCPRLVLQL